MMAGVRAAVLIAAIAAVVAVVLALSAGSDTSSRSDGGAPASGLPPLRDCASRAEGDTPPETTARLGDVVVGPFAFAGLEGVATRDGLKRYRTPPGYVVKSGVSLLAGTRATLVIARPARDWVALSYAAHRLDRVADGDPAVRFEACSRDEPAFSYAGPVGITTGFAGGFILSRPGCVPLEVRILGRSPIRARVPFGVGRCRVGE
jgi:hypothetical protein